MGAKLRAQLELTSLRARVRGQRVAHFLHPGKTAGTALKRALREAPPPPHHELVLHTHGVRMVDLPRSDQFFFVVRDPVDRFVSGFNSRQRQGRPRYERPWSPDEQRAFTRFESPQQLAEALDGDTISRADAVDALRSIEHVRRSYWYWFSDPETFRARFGDVLFVGFQESLDDDLPRLAAALGLERLQLPSDEVAAHRSAPTEPLTPRARDVMAGWYRADYELLEMCQELAAAS